MLWFEELIILPGGWNFFNFWSSRTWIRIWAPGLHSPKSLDLDPDLDSTNVDLNHRVVLILILYLILSKVEEEVQFLLVVICGAGGDGGRCSSSADCTSWAPFCSKARTAANVLSFMG
jgi:hypothetical protein